VRRHRLRRRHGLGRPVCGTLSQTSQVERGAVRPGICSARSRWPKPAGWLGPLGRVSRKGGSGSPWGVGPWAAKVKRYRRAWSPPPQASGTGCYERMTLVNPGLRRAPRRQSLRGPPRRGSAPASVRVRRHQPAAAMGAFRDMPPLRSPMSVRRRTMTRLKLCGRRRMSTGPCAFVADFS
jgi:hypothetical protein